MNYAFEACPEVTLRLLFCPKAAPAIQRMKTILRT